MSSSHLSALCAAVALAAGLVAAGARAQAPAPQLQIGKKVYEDNCAKCHGRSGRGDGPDSIKLGFHPRDFTLGAFKCRCTPTGQPPTDADLLRTVTNGMPGTPMVPNRALSDEQRAAVVQYIKTLSRTFEKAGAVSCAPPPSPPAASPAMIAEGRTLYEKMQCAKCHGAGGRGDGPSASTLVDDWGRPIKPYNFVVLKNFKCGNDDRDLYRTLTTGMTGSPMPSFADALAFDTAGMGGAEKRTLVEHRVWALVQYLRSLQQ